MNTGPPWKRRIDRRRRPLVGTEAKDKAMKLDVRKVMLKDIVGRVLVLRLVDPDAGLDNDPVSLNS